MAATAHLLEPCFDLIARRVLEQERARLGITDGVIRVSIGLEDPDDIKDDLRQALAGLGKAKPDLAAD